MSAVYQLHNTDLGTSYEAVLGGGGGGAALGALLNDGGAHWDDLRRAREGGSARIEEDSSPSSYVGGGSPVASTSNLNGTGQGSIRLVPPPPPAQFLPLAERQHSSSPRPHLIHEPRAFPPPLAPRSYTILKEVGDGSFGTVWLADWHSDLQLPSGTLPPGPSSRPEYKGKKLVAIKRMKKAFEGGWEECMQLKELKSLQQIPMHANIIPLYDAFLLPSSKELYFVFECMEGNLYQLTKSRKGRPLASGLTASIFHQILLGLHHIHESGYFHRDMKPENLLITTTGLADYPPSSLYALPGAPPEKDVVAVVKLADFGLAREIDSSPPYTEYVSTRWYRAPEVLLRARDYSAAVDMWALGTIVVEAITLKPLFPGESQIDQVFKICEVLGNPSELYGVDARGRGIGGGAWNKGLRMAKDVGFAFPLMQPRLFTTLFDTSTVPPQLIECLSELLRYDPALRLTTTQCLQHPYFRDVAPRYRPYQTATTGPTPSVRASSIRSYSSSRVGVGSSSSHVHNPTGPIPHRAPSFDPTTFDISDPSHPNRSSSPGLYHLNQQQQQYPSPQYGDTPMNGLDPPASPAPSSVWRTTPADSQAQWGNPRMQIQSIPAFGGGGGGKNRARSPTHSVAPSTYYDGSVFEGVGPERPSSIMSFPIGYSNLDNASIRSVEPPTPIRPPVPLVAPVPAPSKGRSWGFASVFSNNDKVPPPPPPPASLSNLVEAPHPHPPSAPSIKRSPSIVSMEGAYRIPVDPKKAKKEAEKAAKTAEKAKREAMQHASRERARAVMRKKNQLMEKADALNSFPGAGTGAGVGRLVERQMPQIVEGARYKSSRRRGDEDDDVHSVSSNETGQSSTSNYYPHHPGKAYSIASVATSASDPGERSRHPRAEYENPERGTAPSLYSSNSIRGLPHHAHRYSNSPSRAPNTGHSSLDHQFIANMQGLQTNGSSGAGWESPAGGGGGGRPESRLRPLSPQQQQQQQQNNETRYTPYPVRNNIALAPINSFQEYSAQLSQNGGYANSRQRHGLSTAASVQTYHSTPGVLPSHFHGPLPGMETDLERST